MSTLGDALAVIVAKLEAGGLENVADDPRDVMTPGVFIDMPTGLEPAPCGATGSVSVWIVAPPPATGADRDDLLERRELAERVLTWTRCDYGALFLESGGAGLPGYRFTVPIY